MDMKSWFDKIWEGERRGEDMSAEAQDFRVALTELETTADGLAEEVDRLEYELDMAQDDAEELAGGGY